ncbi:MAG: hypothetical protein KF767_11255 [Bdellovibrionaceae bacterium]|nr:hypothetical protein [Pseudobdellovibrionaceae bacterium]
MKSSLRLRLFQPPVPDRDAADFGIVYDFWRDSWSDVYREIGGTFDPASDNLTRQHEVITLMDGRRPIAMVCHRFVNFKDPSLYADSYFHTGWPPLALKALKRKAAQFDGTGVIGSQIIVAKDWRARDLKLGLKMLISFASFQRVRDLGAAFTIGTIRVDRGMDKVFEACGARVLARGLEYHGATVDLVYFAPSEAPIVIPETARADVEKLWHDLQNETNLRRTG